jgi:hypothetical protein
MGCSGMTNPINAAAFLGTLGLTGTEIALCPRAPRSRPLARDQFQALAAGRCRCGAAIEPVRSSTRALKVAFRRKHAQGRPISHAFDSALPAPAIPDRIAEPSCIWAATPAGRQAPGNMKAGSP